ncbi:sulfatase-like hydrolase/transferase [Luteolibacter algae]|uniref:Sulfatase-like hydrolase/transferase n=1 Tax=Luteolibacter algae TaxID=454151 RepID=A0ABW5DAC1_9BACT
MIPRILFFTISLLLPALRPDLSAADEKRPNLVFILIDDLGHLGISAYGSNKMGFVGGALDDVELSTPNIDKLASRGLRCDRAFTAPLCEPTRIALMSGKYNHRNLVHKKSQHASDITFGDVFKRAGYVTGITGKWKQSRGTKEIPAKDYLYEFGWEEFCCFDLVKQGNRFFNPDLVINGEIRKFDDGIDPETGRRWFGPDICNRFALNFIEKHKDEPFFLYYPLALVHKEDEGNYHVPTPDTYPLDEFDKFDDDFQSPKGNDKATLKNFPEMIRYTDKMVGNVIDKIDSLGLTENTLIVLMGDNGTQKPFIHVMPDGTRYQGRKGSATDHGMHVPLIFSQPGTVPTGKDDQIRSYDGMVNLIDIYPTLCAAADINPPNADEIDGINFWPQILGKAGEHRRENFFYYEEPYFSEKDQKVVLRFAFDKKYKRYAPHPGFPKGRFFDIESDSIEESGNREVPAPHFNIIYHSGLELDKLTPEQQAAFERLGKVIESNRFIPATDVSIKSGDLALAVGKSTRISAEVLPADATINNTIWESSNPGIVTIDKFGVVTAHKAGDTTITLYSWQDAKPMANNLPVTYAKDGMSDSISVKVR